ncbi:olfactory receptor 1M1-like [Hyperolius riggenbachi]|uniref:olfactory receptor 1M1-like n=1 Tax=Hyperolius riggenbachi TaxID=752182 RepID=UPI0035A2EEFA
MPHNIFVFFSYYLKAGYEHNVTTVLFLRFQNIGHFRLLVFSLLLVVYCMTACGNLLIIVSVYFSNALHSPMYFFLSHLSVADIILTTDISPNMLNLILHEWSSISYPSCLTQLYFFGVSETSECFLLTVMSYDRYLAICSPLHYTSMMNQELCIKLTLATWLLSCAITSSTIFCVNQLQFCGSNIIDHFFCDLNPLVELSCSDTSTIQIENTLLCIPVVVLPFLIIVVSYTYIVSTILNISSFSGRLKSFSTCSSHLTVVSIFYGTLISMYVVPNKGQSKTMSKVMSMLYTVLTPFLNPLIYSLRNTDIKTAIRNVVQNLRSSDNFVLGKKK